MRGAFDDDFEQEPAQHRRDTELTLGSGALVAIFGGLAILCGLCFGLGYTLGHRSSQAPAAATPAAEAASQPVASGGSLAKPSATEGAAQPVAVQTATLNSSSVPAAGLAQTADAQTVPASAPAAASQPEIRPALTPAVETTQSAQSAAANPVHPAFTAANASPAGAFMVQIAAVSNAEDASVLTNALRKRGYTVTSRHEPADSLIHVRIGPFVTPAEANTWKMKLLNDGYNAIVQP